MDMNKNESLYFIKAIACFLVVNIHYPYLPLLGFLGSFAVPFFFLVSGYYSYSSNYIAMDNVVKRRTNKILVMTIISFLFYMLASNIIIDGFDNKTLFSADNWKGALLYNSTSFVSVHLWYLLAILYVYLIYRFVINRYKLHNIFYMLSIGLLILNVVLPVMNTGIRLPGFLFVGLPFFMIGNFFGKYKDINFNRLKMKKYIEWTILIAIILITIVEYAYGREKLGISICGILWAVYLLVYSISNPNKLSNRYICAIGEKHASNIYIFHMFFIWALAGQLDRFNSIITYFGSTIFFGLTLLFSMVILRIGNYIKIRRYRVN